MRLLGLERTKTGVRRVEPAQTIQDSGKAHRGPLRIGVKNVNRRAGSNLPNCSPM
jgi:hypothetical protein